jgi:hypothetical protein
VARLTSLQVWATDLATSARLYGAFLGLELPGEPHRHPGNEALHYDLVWGDMASGEYMMLQIAQREGQGRHTTGAEIGVTVEDVDVVHTEQGRLG